MDNVCYTAVIRQQMCQSGVPVTRENVYSNIQQESVITLLNGYTLYITNSVSDTANLRFVNNILGINLVFNIAVGSVAMFDLPVESTIFRVSVFVQSRCCCPNSNSSRRR